MKTILRCNILILLVIVSAVVLAQEQPQKRAVDDEGTRVSISKCFTDFTFE